MTLRIIRQTAIAALCAALAIIASFIIGDATARSAPGADGIVRVRSAYAVPETIERVKADIAAKGIRFFTAIDQAQLAAEAGIALGPSTLLIFGNPPLGTQFIAANPNAGLDWPVRLLVTEDASGSVWVVYTDFRWLAARHGITSLDPQFRTASEVIASITASIAAR